MSGRFFGPTPCQCPDDFAHGFPSRATVSMGLPEGNRRMSSHNSGSIRLIPEGGDWTLVLERVLEHPRGEVWAALTRSDRMIAWGPFAADRDLNAPGGVRLTPVNMPGAEAAEGRVLQVDEPHLLVLRWGPDILRWELGGECRCMQKKGPRVPRRAEIRGPFPGSGVSAKSACRQSAVDLLSICCRSAVSWPIRPWPSRRIAKAPCPSRIPPPCPDFRRSSVRRTG